MLRLKQSLARVGLAAVLIVLAGVASARAEVTSLYLVQNSGWMEPFFVDPGSDFKPLLSALIQASHGNGEVVLASFNQDGQLSPRRSPEVIYRGAYDEGRISTGLAALDLPVRSDGRMTDSDFNGALIRGVTEILGGRTGIIWLVTNNKNSPNNSQQVKENTRAFARQLRESDALPCAVSYPLRMEVRGKHYEEHGLIVYGIAYGDEAAAVLRNTLKSEPMWHLFSNPPMLLKPLEQAPLHFIPKQVTTPGISARSLPDGGLVLEGVPPDGGTVIEIQGTLKSEYYPYVIDTATVGLQWARLETAGGAAGLTAAIEPAELHRLAPQDVLDNVSLKITTPRVQRPDGLSGLLENEVSLDGDLSIELSNVKMTMQDDFVQRVVAVTALDQLPEVFFDYKRISIASARVPIRLVFHYSSLSLILGLLSLLPLLVILAAAAVLMRRRRVYTVTVGGVTRRVALRPFESKTFMLQDGGKSVVRGGVFGPARVETTSPRKPSGTERRI